MAPTNHVLYEGRLIPGGPRARLNECECTDCELNPHEEARSQDGPGAGGADSDSSNEGWD